MNDKFNQSFLTLIPLLKRIVIDTSENNPYFLKIKAEAIQAFEYIIKLVSNNKEAINQIYGDCKILSDELFNIIMNETQNQIGDYEEQEELDALSGLK